MAMRYEILPLLARIHQIFLFDFPVQYLPPYFNQIHQFSSILFDLKLGMVKWLSDTRQSSFRAVLEQFTVSEQFQSSFRAVFSFRAVSEQF